MNKQQEQSLIERNAELQRELELEAALERVRTVAMGMRKPNDLLDICQVLFEALRALRFTDLRNAMINLVNDEKGSFLNYDFNGAAASVVQFSYGSHPVIDRQIEVTRSATDAFIEHTLTGDDLEDFKAFRVKNGEGPDPRLKNITTLYYYFYSIGNGSVGISVFSPLTEGKLEVLKRFRNVFDLAYRRYADIEQAAAQAREAKIEASLERVRSRSMGMQTSDELKEVIQIIYEQFVYLNINIDHTGFVVDYKAGGDWSFWVADQLGSPAKLTVANYDCEWNNRFDEAKEKGIDFFATNLDFEQKNKFYRDLFDHAPAIPEQEKELIFSKPALAISTVLLDDVALYIENYAGTSYTDEENAILMRFGKVFQQTYTRFLDLQKAEAQAREAQIEAALERVRSRAMAMHKTDELLDAAELLYRELTNLGIESMAVTYSLMDDAEKNAFYYSINPVDGKINPKFFELPHDETDVMRSILSSWKKKETVNVIALDEEATIKHQTYIAEKLQTFLTGSNINMTFSVGAFLAASPKKAIIYTFNFAQGYIFIIGGARLTKEQEEMVLRFTKVFELTYRRFLDIKHSEEQARESQIQLALERVRARMMAMQKSSELALVIQAIYDQLVHLGLDVVTAGFIMDYKKSAGMNLWVANQGQPDAYMVNIPYYDGPIYNLFDEAIEKGIDFYTVTLNREEKNTHYRHAFQHTRPVPDEVKEMVYDMPGYADSHVLLKDVVLFISNLTGIPYSDEENDILMRFGKVFEQTYTRFKDLEQAEAQAKESQIQLALERVRARTMAMQKSEELAETVFILFQQFKELGENPDQATIGVINEEEHVIEYWVTMHGEQTNRVFKFSIDEPNVTGRIYKAWKANKKSLVIDLSGKSLQEFMAYRESMGGAPAKKGEKRRIINVAFFSKGLINVQSTEERSEESIRLLERFAGVFDGTYTRFLDLKQAEELAHESQIQLALERVRARTSAMQKSEELHEVIQLVFDQLHQLNFKIDVANFAPNYKETDDFDLWLAVASAKYAMKIHVPYFEHPMFDNFNKAKKKEGLFTDILSKDEKNRFFEHFFKYTPAVADDRRSVVFAAPGFARSAAFMKNTALSMMNYEGVSYSEAENNVLMRFGQVFDQTYTRFSDLKQAEEQARESQIQLALERVRARTMAMQKSEELHEVIQLVFDQLQQLNFDLDVANFAVNYKETDDFDLLLAVPHGTYPMKIHVPYFQHPIFDRFNKAKEKGGLLTDTFSKSEKDSFFEHFFKYIPGAPEGTKASILSRPGFVRSTVLMKNTALTIHNYDGIPFSEAENNTLLRFGQAFDQTYTRFNDLKQAEAQAREAEIQLALERVRARTMAMQHSEELAETAGVLFRQLHNLDIVPERVFVGIPIEGTRKIDLWGTEQGGTEMNTRFEAETDATHAFRQLFKACEDKASQTEVILKDKDLAEHINYVANVLDMPVRMELVQDQRVLYGTYFSKGWLVTVTPDILSRETLNILQRFAAVFDQTYTRFLDLERAEAQARESQIQLALERVRARTMAMHKSDELSETAVVLFQQLSELGDEPARLSIGIPDGEGGAVNFWATDQEGGQINTSFVAKLSEQTTLSKMYAAWKAKTKSASVELRGEDLKNWVRFCREDMGIVIKDDLLKARRIHTIACFSHGWINYTTHEPPSSEAIHVLERFAAMFSYTYTRFLDLQKAEAQAREGQIQLGLERVRAKAMSMQNSDELNALVGTVFEELTKLDFILTRCLIMIFDPETLASRWWMANSEVPEEPANYLVQNHNNPAYLAYLKAWHERILQWQYALKGKVKRDWDDFLFVDTELSGLPEVVIEGMKAPEEVLLTASFNNFGCLTLVSIESLSDEHSDILLRFAKVFDMSYTRFSDLKQAEAQAREAKIEASLERVRAKAMAMFSSEDLSHTVNVFFKELKALGITPIRCGVGQIDGETRTVNLTTTSSSSQGDSFEVIGKLKQAGHPVLEGVHEHWKRQEEYYPVLHGADIKVYYNVTNAQVAFRDHSEDITQYGNFFYFKEGMVFAWTEKELLEDDLKIFRRFTSVLSLTYRRYIDLTESEAQARDGRIQLGLERVRAAAMAMHDSAGVSDATALVFTELYKLGISTIRCGVCIVDGASKEIEVWSASQEEGKISRGIGKLDMTAHPLWVYLLNAWKDQKASFTYELKGKELADYYHIIRNAAGYHAPDNKAMYNPAAGIENETQYCNCYIFKEGCLFTFTHEPFSYEAGQVLEKFAAVFGLTYRRYLDLTKAEAQVREAQIEAALERVRSKTMAMHNSADVGETVTLMFNELVKLGVDKIARCGIAIPDHNGLIELWTAKLSKDEKEEMIIGHIDTAIHPMLAMLYDAWKSKQADFLYILEGNDLNNYITALNNYRGYPIKYNPGAWGTKQYHNDFFFPEGMVFAFTFQPLSADIASIFKRFAGVFGQTYRRYLDLQKAENQAREAQIEAALERVRSKAMAMRSSDDLNATANTVFVELRKLGVDLVRCGLGLMQKEDHISTIHAATNSAEGGNLEVLGNINMDIHPVFVGIYNHWRKNEDYFPVLEGQSLKAYYEKLHESAIAVPEWKSGEKQYGYFFPFADGSLYAWSGEQVSEATIKTLKRFTSVIGLTYTRYIELQKAEINTKEAIKQASLDRVRAEIASMRKQSDLERITPLIWNELTILGIPFIRCGVFIMDEGQKLIHTFLSTPDGKAIGAFHVPYNTPGNFMRIVDGWRKKHVYTDHWKEADFLLFADALYKQGAIASKENYMKMLPHDGVYLNFLPFLQGMLYAGNTAPLTEEEIDLIQSVAEAFSTAYARYEDFNKLEAAKQQVDNTLTQLKATQNKLIQSEKMASLGELTAGIAHEIQNPLNFVNNFSEVSAELIDEMDEELDKGDIEEAKAIAVDIKQNLAKIRHHGGRADGIVKGMLQHSRASSGQKDPTDLNSLADEYLRLAYHGLRAKDKSFNAEMITHFDEKLPKASVVPQDIGRVLINLYNNAFYATQQKAKTAGADYKPEVTVTTSSADDQVTIRVKDNGDGIPNSIKDKIMQPFFTTKPTGEGTGLGLSLSYDIVVKGHGGNIAVDSKEGTFTEFMVILPLKEI